MDSTFFIEHTPNKEEASNFYLKPIIRSLSKGDKYFHIVTDPEDYQRSICKQAREQTTADQKDSSGGASTGSERDVSEEGSKTHQHDPSKNTSQSETVQSETDSQKTPSDDQLDDVLEPQRYMTVNVDGQVATQLNLKHLKKKANSIFKLKNLHNNNTVPQPLSKSQWLPEAIRGSQPHILCCQGTGVRSFIRRGKFWSVYIKMEKHSEKKIVSYGRHLEGGVRYGYLILEDGHYT